MFLKERPIQLQSGSEMVQRLFVVFVIEVSLSQLGVSSDQYEQILSVDIHENFTDSKLLNSYLDLSV